MIAQAVYLKPNEGWGFAEKVDGSLAPRFEVEILESAVEFAPGVVGWKAKALDGEYAGAKLQITPRHAPPWSGWVALEVKHSKNGRLLFSGMARSNGLKPSWDF